MERLKCLSCGVGAKAGGYRQATVARRDAPPRGADAGGFFMPSNTDPTSHAPVAPSQPTALLARNAASNTAASLAEIARSSRSLWTGAAAKRATPLDFAARGGQWWSSMTDRRVPTWHLPHRTVLSTPFAHVHDFSPAGAAADVVPTLVLPPQAGRSSHVVDFAAGQSQLTVLLEAGLTQLYAMEWRPATAETREVTITDYLNVIDRAIVHAGGRANLVGDCQGGWLATIYAALHPDRVHTLTLAGAPIDFHAGESLIAASTHVMTRALGMAPYRALVALNGGNMSGRAVLANFILMQPQTELGRQLQLFENVDDPQHVERYRLFEDWASTPRTSRAPSTCGWSTTSSTATSSSPVISWSTVAVRISRTSPARCSCSPGRATTSPRRPSCSPPRTPWGPRARRSCSAPPPAGIWVSSPGVRH